MISLKSIIVPPLALLIAFAAAPTARAQSDPGAQPAAEQAQSAQGEQAQVLRRLLSIQLALEERRERIRSLLEQVESADETEREKLREQVAAHRQMVAELTASFESLAAAGANLHEEGADEEARLVWHEELTQIARPIIDSLKEATAKPRRIAELRSMVKLYQQQLDAAERALASIEGLRAAEPPPSVADGLDLLDEAWRQRAEDTRRSFELARDELNGLEVSDVRIFETFGRAGREFLLGSGLTLLFALIAGIVVWLVLRALRRLVRIGRDAAASREQVARYRVLLYAYQLFSLLAIALAVLTVFYVRGDLLLLSLAIIALAMVALGAWRYLPGYVGELRLLLNVGAAREGERLTYAGLPFRIASLNLYSELRNPELEGSIRLPLSAMAQLTSRPRTDEAWFPSRVGDYLLLPDGSFAQVLRQTVELVQLKVMGSIVQIASSEFLHSNAQNLSREGFGIAVTFGIDYQHQAFALDAVPARLREGLAEAFDAAELGEYLRDLLVEFKSAGASSLDYLVYATFDGRGAASYFRLGRLIQQACVDVCNREGWVIPFTQVTIHQGEAPADDMAGASTVPA